MKKLKLLIVISAMLLLTSCGIIGLILPISIIDSIENIDKCIVTFCYNNGHEDEDVYIEKGECIKKPDDPNKDYYDFNGWYLEKNHQTLFDFNTKIVRDITLYADYSLNITSTSVTEQVLATNVVVELYEYNTLLGTVVSSSAITGSGVIYKAENGYYYALTNNHVVYKNNDYNYFDYSVYDYKGNKYYAEVMSNDPNYDLAVVRFKCSNLNIINFALDDPSIASSVVAIGQPRGVTNTITAGSVNRISKVKLDETSRDESNVRFDVIVHSAEIYSGSSGGALLNSKNELVGINFAGAENVAGKCVAAYAIPISKVREYLTIYA